MRPVIAVALAFVCLPALVRAADFTLTSSSFADGGTLSERHVYSGFGCSGDTLSPALSWSGAPAGTKSFVVTAYDPDAPTGSGWWHWVLYDLPASTSSLPEGVGRKAGQALPEGAVEGVSDYGSAGFGGACPPQGDKPHRYVFTVHALKVEKLEPPLANASPALIGFLVHFNKLASASVTATYGR